MDLPPHHEKKDNWTGHVPHSGTDGAQMALSKRNFVCTLSLSNCSSALWKWSIFRRSDPIKISARERNAHPLCMRWISLFFVAVLRGALNSWRDQVGGGDIAEHATKQDSAYCAYQCARACAVCNGCFDPRARSYFLGGHLEAICDSRDDHSKLATLISALVRVLRWSH